MPEYEYDKKLKELEVLCPNGYKTPTEVYLKAFPDLNLNKCIHYASPAISLITRAGMHCPCGGIWLGNGVKNA